MIIGNPYQFAVLTDNVKEWNSEISSFRNGVLLYCIEGEIYPKQVVTATLNAEIPPVIETLENLNDNEELFKMETEMAYSTIYNITFPEDGGDNDYQFDISPYSLSDNNCYVFAVSFGKKVRIMAAKLDFIKSDSRHNLTNLDISEAFISDQELTRIILEMNVMLNSISD